VQLTARDNPFSEAQFKTLKYCPAFPSRFGSIADARAFCGGPSSRSHDMRVIHHLVLGPWDHG
jgi:hypothetical protein